jgi:hypothetical protein
MVEVQENELWTGHRQPWTIILFIRFLTNTQRKLGLKFKKMSCGLWSVSRGRLAAVTATQFESQIGLRLI